MTTLGARDSAEAVDFRSVARQYAEQCSAEPIHLLGRVQPHGFIVVVHCQTRNIVQVSSGITRHLPFLHSVDTVLETLLDDWVLPQGTVLEGLLASLPTDFSTAVNAQWKIPANEANFSFECLGYRVGEYAVLEWIPKPEAPFTEQLESRQMLQLSRSVAKLRQAGTLEDFYQDCVTELQALSGYDHVMLYRFLPDWSGEVVAEQSAPGVSVKFLGMRFPKGDIPAQARALYEANTLRVLADVDAVPDVMLPGLLPEGKPLNMGHCLLRGMSQSHVLYLRNMGVRATLTISLLREGRLWGLVACHHHQPRVLRDEVREVLRSSCDLVASLVLMQFDHLERVKKANRNAVFVQIFSALNQGLAQGADFVQSLTTCAVGLCQAFDAHYFGMRFGSFEFVASQGADGLQTRQILDDVEQRCINPTDRAAHVYGVHALRMEEHEAIAGMPDAAGLLMVRVPVEKSSFCFFARATQVKSVRWAGQPDEVTLVTKSGYTRVEPRRSFEVVEQDVRDGAVPWDDTDVHAISQLAVLLGDAYRNYLNRELQEQLHWRAHHDPLTGLFNRSVVELELTRKLALPRARVALFLIDLDHFKRINDRLGHAVGDEVLVEIGKRLSHCTRDLDVVARLGGDEFLLFTTLTESSAEQSSAIAQRLHAAMVEGFEVDGKTLTLKVSVGVAFSPEHGTDASTLMRHADMALYEAKGLGRGRTAIFDMCLEGEVLNSMELEDQLRHAIGHGELRLHYQPKIHLLTGKVCGFEALVRWQHPVRGLLVPQHFIAVAERSQLIDELGRWVIDEAMAQLHRWNLESRATLPIAVNVSFVQILSGSLVRDLRECSVKHGVDLQMFEVELTETVAMENAQQTVETLRELSKLGVRASLDDFGIGYSSLSYLQELPLDALKIDRSFVTRLERDRQSHIVMRGIMGLAHGLKLGTIAEGVETREQWRWLRVNRCQIAQGYLFSPPVPASAIEAVVSTIESMQLPPL